MSEMVWHERLKELRKGLHMRQEDVAAYLGVARTTYLNIEAGERAPRADELNKLSALYKMSVEEMYGAVITNEPRPELKKAWVCISMDEARLLRLVREGDLRGAMEFLLKVVRVK